MTRVKEEHLLLLSLVCRNLHPPVPILMHLGCLETHMNDVMKHVVLCEAAKQLVIKDKPVVQLISELRTQGLASVLSVCCCRCKQTFELETSPRLKNMDTSTANYDINVPAVCGSIVTGNGASHLKKKGCPVFPEQVAGLQI